MCRLIFLPIAFPQGLAKQHCIRMCTCDSELSLGGTISNATDLSFTVPVDVCY